MLTVAWHKVRSDLREQTRYPLQMLVGMGTTAVFLWGLGLAAARVTGQSADQSALGVFVAVAAFIAYYGLPRSLTGGQEHPPEELMLYPRPAVSLMLTIGTITTLQVSLALSAIYLAALLVTGNHTDEPLKVGVALLCGMFSVYGLSLLTFALRLVFQRVDAIASLIQLSLLSVAFLPLGAKVQYALPLVGVVRWVGDHSVSLPWVLASAAIWLVLGLLGVRLAERVVTRRGIAAHG